MSRRTVLRSAAAVGGGVAAVPLLSSLAGSAVASSATKTTLGRTYRLGTPNAAGYGPVVEAPGEPHLVRNDLGI